MFEARLARRLQEMHTTSLGMDLQAVVESLQELRPKPDLTRDVAAKPDIVPLLRSLEIELDADRCRLVRRCYGYGGS